MVPPPPAPRLGRSSNTPFEPRVTRSRSGEGKAASPAPALASLSRSLPSASSVSHTEQAPLAPSPTSSMGASSAAGPIYPRVGLPSLPPKRGRRTPHHAAALDGLAKATDAPDNADLATRAWDAFDAWIDAENARGGGSSSGKVKREPADVELSPRPSPKRPKTAASAPATASVLDRIASLEAQVAALNDKCGL